MQLDNEAFTSFWGHLEELRRTLLRVIVTMISSVAICFVCSEPILSILKKPLSAAKAATVNEERLAYFRIHNPESVTKKIVLPTANLVSSDLSNNIELVEKGSYLIFPGGSLVYAKTGLADELVILGPLEGILFSLKLSFWIGIFISSPFWLYILSRFFLPGLQTHEKRLVLPFIATSLVFIIIGCLFAYFIAIPLANQYLMTFNQHLGTNLWSLGNYLDYTLFLLMANGIAFELGAIGIFAVHLQFLSVETLAENRRIAILGAFILAAVLTPPDILTQFMLAIPLIGLYEALILYARARSPFSCPCP